MKSTQSTVKQRVRDVLQRILEGSTRAEIVQYYSKKFKVSERQVDNYIKAGNKLIKESVTKDSVRDYALALARFEQLYNLNFNKNDFKTCVSINKEICQLQGLYTTKIEHSGDIHFISNIPE